MRRSINRRRTRVLRDASAYPYGGDTVLQDGGVVEDGNGQTNVDIFICSHKMFTPKVSNPLYKVLFTRKGVYGGDELGGLRAYCYDGDRDDRYWSESCTFKWICGHAELSDYVGICHYRKYFSFMDGIPNMDKLFTRYDVVCGKPIKMSNGILKQYSRCHNVKDLNLLRNILSERYADFSKSFESFMECGEMYPYEMTIMRREDFVEYAAFIDDVLSEFMERIGNDIGKRIAEDRVHYLKRFKPNNTVEYQQRILGYLSERLTAAYVRYKFRKPYTVSIKITEKKY